VAGAFQISINPHFFFPLT